MDFQMVTMDDICPKDSLSQNSEPKHDGYLPAIPKRHGNSSCRNSYISSTDSKLFTTHSQGDSDSSSSCYHTELDKHLNETEESKGNYRMKRQMYKEPFLPSVNTEKTQPMNQLIHSHHSSESLSDDKTRFTISNSNHTQSLVNEQKLQAIKDCLIKETILKLTRKWRRDRIYQRYDRTKDYENLEKQNIYTGKSTTKEWMYNTGATRLKNKKKNIGKYKKFKTIAQTQDSELFLKTLTQIHIDMSRSIYQSFDSQRSRLFVCTKEDGELKTAGRAIRFVFQVLTAYAVYDKVSSYTQGMDKMVGWFYFHLEDGEDDGENCEEDAFWYLNSLMAGKRHHNGIFYDVKKMESADKSYQKLIWGIIKNEIPDLYRHLDGIQNAMEQISMVIIYSWTIRYYITDLPYDLVRAFWDHYTFYGDEMLVAMMYCIFYMHKEEVKKMKNSEDIIQYFRSLSADFRFPIEDTIMQLQECMMNLSLGEPTTSGNPHSFVSSFIGGPKRPADRTQIHRWFNVTFRK